VLTHAPRQAHVWQIFDVSQSMHRVTTSCPCCFKTSVIVGEITTRQVFTCPQCHHELALIEPISGYVYILSNPTMPGLLKIGFTEREVSARIEELSSHTGVAARYEEEARFAVENPVVVERKIHAELAPFRHSANREFFRLSASKAIDVVTKFAGDPVFNAAASRIAREERMSELRKAVRRQVRSEPRSSGSTTGGFGSSR